MSDLSNRAKEMAAEIGKLAKDIEGVETPNPRVVEAMRTMRRGQQQVAEAGRLLAKSSL